MVSGRTLQILALLQLSCARGSIADARRGDDGSWRNERNDIGHSTLDTAGGTSTNRVVQSAPSGARDSARTKASRSIRAVLLHKSTGGMVYLNGKLADWIASYNSSHQTSYVVNELTYPIEGVGFETANNWPWEYWQIWVNHAGATAYNGEPTLEMLTQQYQVIIWKNCFTASYVTDDIGQASLTSPERRVENYKLHYAALKAKMREFPSTRFIVWTLPAPGAMHPDNVVLLRGFVNWVRNTWDEPGDNIYLWDFQRLETNGGDLALLENIVSVDDPHPVAAFSLKVAPLLGQRFVNVVEGRGDTSNRTGE